MKIASIQLNSQNNVEANLAIIKVAIKTAADNHADLVVLPENACYMGKQADIAGRFDELSKILGGFAKECKVHLLAGTLPCPYYPDGTKIADRYRQSSLLFDKTGVQLVRYDKIHLFRATVADGVGVYDEGQTFCAGDRLVAVDCMIDGQIYKIGMMICFDLRFAKLSQNLRQMGADILVAPSAFTYATGQKHWQLLLQARAIDSQCMVVGAAQGGIHKTKNNERHTWGHSAIINGDGAVVDSTNCTQVNENGFLIAWANFDKRLQDNFRQQLPIGSCHRLA